MTKAEEKKERGIKARLKGYLGEMTDIKIIDDEQTKSMYRQWREGEPVPAIYKQSTSYAMGGVKKIMWCFYCWSDTVKDRIIYE